MKFEFNWPSGFRRRCLKMLTDGRTDGRTTDAGVTGILIAHLGAFGSGELKNLALISCCDQFPLSHPQDHISNYEVYLVNKATSKGTRLCVCTG